MEGRNAGVLIGLENRDDGVKSVVQVRTLFPLLRNAVIRYEIAFINLAV